jgi:hypothetical protein
LVELVLARGEQVWIDEEEVMALDELTLLEALLSVVVMLTDWLEVTFVVGKTVSVTVTTATPPPFAAFRF